jgi:UDP-2,3-diacylglucosamine pyrophosphatase LpxH
LSDLHVGDGTASDDFSFDKEFSLLLKRIDEADPQAELVILGDGLEILESEFVRNLGLVDFSTVCNSLDGEVIEAIYEKHKLFFESLKRFAQKHKIIYVVGNHDYYLVPNEKLRKQFLEKIDSEKMEIVPYFYDEKCGIFAQHGNQYDVSNSFALTDKKKLIPPIGDYITRRVMNEFEPFLSSLHLPEEVVRDYDNIRPLSHAVDWLKYITYLYKLPVDLTSAWKKSFSKAFQSEEAKSWIKVRFPYTYWMSDFFTQKSGWFDFGRKIVSFIDMLFKIEDTNYLKRKAEKLLNAHWNPQWKLSEKDMAGYTKKIPELDYLNLKLILFGHNHQPGFYVIPTPKGARYYANTGTWRPLVERSKSKFGGITFHKKIELNYVLVKEEKDEIIVETQLTSRIKISER